MHLQTQQTCGDTAEFSWTNTFTKTSKYKLVSQQFIDNSEKSKIPL